MSRCKRSSLELNVLKTKEVIIEGSKVKYLSFQPNRWKFYGVCFVVPYGGLVEPEHGQ